MDFSIPILSIYNEYEHILYKHSKKQSYFRGLFDSDVNYIYKIIIFIL